jgi:hypothetical protein
MMPTQNVRYAVEVKAGLIPGQPTPEFTRQWFVTTDEWRRGEHHSVEDPESAWSQARAYAEQLVDPAVVNWVSLEWVWF